MSEFDFKPQRGEIWRANLEPAVGGEIQKDNRPVIVLSRPSVGAVGVSLCAPITDFKPDRDARRFWRVFLDANDNSGLEKPSCADVGQTRALDIARFVRQDGKAAPLEIEAVVAALVKTVGYIAPATPKSKE